VGIVEFNEENFRLPGTSIEVIAELQNTRVNSAPAKLEQVLDGRGRGRTTLVWAGENKVYTLIATGDGHVERNAAVLQQIAAIRGAVNGLMSEVMEAHLREEFGQPAQSDAQRAARVAEMSGLIRSYLK